MPRRWDAWKTQDAPRKAGGGVLFYNNRYHVILSKHRNRDANGPDIIHLSIRDNNRTAEHDWRDYQRIKNEIVGPEVEMVELYPRQSHIVDTSNQFHLWGFATEEPVFTKAGVGWEEGPFLYDGIGPNPLTGDGIENAVQRPMDEPMDEAARAALVTKWATHQQRTKDNV